MSDTVQPSAELGGRSVLLIGQITVSGALRVLLTSLFTTGLWAVIFHAGSIAFDIAIPANLLFAALSVIFILLTVGLAIMGGAIAETD
jgi:hypothetical protein